MSKAVLVLDEMPDDCDECPLCRYDEFRSKSCNATIYSNYIILRENGKKKPDWCPLRPFPEKYNSSYDTDYGVGYIRGWNDCLKAIEGSGKA